MQPDGTSVARTAGMKLRWIAWPSIVLVSACALPLGCSSSDGGGGPGADASDQDAPDATDAPNETSDEADAPHAEDADGDAGAEADADGTAPDASDGGADADADADAATVDADTDAGTGDGGEDAGVCTALYCGETLDVAVDSQNLYLLMIPSTTIARCPLAGCAGAPTVVRESSGAQRIEAADSMGAPNAPGTVYYTYNVSGGRIMSVSAAGGTPTELWRYSGAPNFTFLELRMDNRVLYASGRASGLGTPAFYVRKTISLQGAGTAWGDTTGAPIFDVRGDFAVLAWTDPSGGAAPPYFRSQQISTGVMTWYTAPTPAPSRVTINQDMVVFSNASGTYFCPRASTCAAPVRIPGITAADVALDADYLYLGTSTGVMRCANTEMVGGTCTATPFLPTAGAVRQLVLAPSAIYARTAEPSVVGRAIP